MKITEQPSWEQRRSKIDKTKWKTCSNL